MKVITVFVFAFVAHVSANVITSNSGTYEGQAPTFANLVPGEKYDIMDTADEIVISHLPTEINLPEDIEIPELTPEPEVEIQSETEAEEEATPAVETEEESTTDSSSVENEVEETTSEAEVEEESKPVEPQPEKVPATSACQVCFEHITELVNALQNAL